jgi:hypothetical protein
MSKDDIIDRLKDDIHDLTIDLAEARIDVAEVEKENTRLESELISSYNDESVPLMSLEIERLRCEAQVDQGTIRRREENIKTVTDQVRWLSENYLKALTILETLSMNGQNNLEYLSTDEGKHSLLWANDEYKREMDKFLLSLGARNKPR